MKYTFLLPVYKGRFLREALESISSQTYEEFCVLISDDCSPEPINEIVKPYLSDPRFLYRRNDKNIGAEHLVTHWNLLLDLCSTPYLIMAGDDDVYEPDFLTNIDQLILRFPESNLIRSRLDVINSEGMVIDTETLFPEVETMPEFITDLFDPRHIHSIGQYVFKTSFLKTQGGFVDFPLAWFSDDATAILASSGGVASSSSTSFHARRSGLNISSTDDKKSKRMKGSAVVSFHKWYKSFATPYDDHSRIWRDSHRNSKKYCYDRLINVFEALSLRERMRVLLEFPMFSWVLFKDFLNTVLKKSNKNGKD